MQQTNNDWSEVPNDVWDALARAILEEIQALAATDEGQRELQCESQHLRRESAVRISLETSRQKEKVTG